MPKPDLEAGHGRGPDSAQHEIRTAFMAYLDTYFGKRDLAATLVMLSTEPSGFGTGIDEIAINFDEFEKLYSRDVSEAPNAIYYEIKQLHIAAPIQDMGIAACILNIKTSILNQEIKLNNLRLSAVFVKTDESWQLAHMHISFPTSVHENKEAFPIKELEKRNKVLQKLVKDKTENLNAAIKQISILATTDKLTGIFNRSKIDDCLCSEILRSERYLNKLSVILIDIDHFKLVNDNYGHLAGDKVLIELGQMITGGLRKTDFAGRWGGEEFLVICPETSPENAAQIAEGLRSGIEILAFQTAGRVTASIGVTSYQPGDTPETLLERADAALYAAKRNGRNQVVTK